MALATVCYFHGFASGPESQKGLLIRDAFMHQAQSDVHYVNPDLNGDNFLQLTMDSWQHRASNAVQQCDHDLPILLCGSSLGAYSAALLSDMLADFPAAAVLLLAPAFAFVDNWQAVVGEQGVATWQREGKLPFYHYAYERDEELGYAFYESCARFPAYPPVSKTLKVPMHILHGTDDDVCAVDHVREYAARSALITLDCLDDGHGLLGEPSQRHIQNCARAMLHQIL